MRGNPKIAEMFILPKGEYKGQIVRIGIITITNDKENYGNVLQNYALQQFLKQEGISSRTIRNYSFKERRIGGFYLILRFFMNRRDTIRRIKFWIFRHRHIAYSSQIVTRKNRNLNRLSSAYDAFICGSDQVWNPEFSFNHNWDLMLLRFTEHHKKIAYSASFGVEKLTEPYRTLFADALKDFKAISVREETGCRLVETLTGQKPCLLSDPVMLIRRSNWDQIALPVRSLKGKVFIVLYILGEKNAALSECLSQLQNKYPGALIVEPADYNSPYYNTDPGEFVWMIKNCAAVVTDSFHATAFSIIYERYLCVIKRCGTADYMFDRLETILKRYGIQKSIYEGGNLPEYSFGSLDISKTLSEERQRASDFIVRALD